VVLLTGVVVILLALVGVFILSGLDTADDPVVDVEVSVNESTVRITHGGGDRLALTDVRVVFGEGGTGSDGLENFTEVNGDGDGGFDGGEIRETSHGATDVIAVTVVHEPSNTVIAREVLDVATGVATSTPTPTPTPSPETLTWSSAADWDAAVSETGVVHESFGDRQADELSLGYQSTESGLVAYWPLDEDSGSMATDVSGTGNSGTITGDPGLNSDGIAGSSGYDLDGSGDYVRIPDSSSLEMSDTDAVTVSTWVNKDAVQSGWIALVQKSDRSYNLQFQNGNTPVFTIYDSNWHTADSDITAQNGRWLHLVGTFDGSTVRMYVNGTLVGTATATEIADSGGADLGIGENLDTSGREVDAQMDEVRIYDRALSSSEARSLYNATSSGSLTTGTKVYSSSRDVNRLELRNVQATRPSEVTVHVESDPDGDGTFEESSDPVTLDGSGTHSITGLATDSAEFRLRVEFDSPDVTRSPTFGGADLHSPS